MSKPRACSISAADHGVECGPIDILICAVAVKMHYDILTYDQGLKRCIQVLRTEGLIQ